LPAIFVFDFINNKLNIKNTVITENLILDIAFDDNGKLWIANFVDENTKELITVMSKVVFWYLYIYLYDIFLIYFNVKNFYMFIYLNIIIINSYLQLNTFQKKN